MSVRRLERRAAGSLWSSLDLVADLPASISILSKMYCCCPVQGTRPVAAQGRGQGVSLPWRLVSTLGAELTFFFTSTVIHAAVIAAFAVAIVVRITSKVDGLAFRELHPLDVVIEVLLCRPLECSPSSAGLGMIRRRGLAPDPFALLQFLVPRHDFPNELLRGEIQSRLCEPVFDTEVASFLGVQKANKADRFPRLLAFARDPSIIQPRRRIGHGCAGCAEKSRRSR